MGAGIKKLAPLIKQGSEQGVADTYDDLETVLVDAAMQ